ncbi:MAG: PilZ domain-containing protein [Azoarcus sp.]|jgi:hypothetical protein|nr:PilZ domain-containing protein [Azoarcus sp.]
MPSLFPFFVTTSFSSRKPADAAPKSPSAATGVPSPGESAPDMEKPSAPLPAVDASERRIHQRFMARLHGETCFWVQVGEERVALDDLSLKGFALPATTTFAKGAKFGFTLQREGVPDTIRGHAEVVNVFGKSKTPSAGCRILVFEGDGAERLHDWLVTHVIRSATVRITEKDAAAIVAGGSLI